VVARPHVGKDEEASDSVWTKSPNVCSPPWLIQRVGEEQSAKDTQRPSFKVTAVDQKCPSRMNLGRIGRPFFLKTSSTPTHAVCFVLGPQSFLALTGRIALF